MEDGRGGRSSVGGNDRVHGPSGGGDTASSDAGRRAGTAARHRRAESLHLRAMVMDTQWGLAWIIQCVAGVGAAIAFWMAVRRARGSWGLAGVAAVVLAFSPALGGHAIASPQSTSLAVIADGLHVLGAAGWLGSLTCVVLIGLPAVRTQISEDRWRTIASLVNAFSPTALSCDAVVGLTGC